ncbi:MAG: hypothetical protein ACFFF4_01290 [Candidatus Thorarchaeota archaeon]
MTNDEKIMIQDPSDNCIHSASQHPVYSDHFITDCGMVVTTSATRHETNHTNFVIIDTTKITCNSCKTS